MATFENDVQKLIESTIDNSGTLRVRIISPGWGSSGYYSADALRNAAPLYKKGTHCYWNHPSKSEERDRPERDLRDLAGVLAEDARWSTTPEPGIYARVKVFAPYRAVVREMAPHIGISHRASGSAKHGSAEGRSGPIIEEITDVLSVDFVTAAGRGGTIIEAARREVAEAFTFAEQMEPTLISLYHSYRNFGMSEADARRAAERDGWTIRPAKMHEVDGATRELAGRYSRFFGISESEALAATGGRDGPPLVAVPPQGMGGVNWRLYKMYRQFGLTESEARAAVGGR